MLEEAVSADIPRIFINGRFLSQRITGVQRYARETLLALDALLANGTNHPAQFRILIPPGTLAPTLKQISVLQVGSLSGHLWEQIELPWHARAGLLLSFGFTGPLVKANQIITIHDAAVIRMPNAYDWKFRAWYRLLVGVITARSATVLAVSQFSANEAITCFGVAPERIRVTTEGWQHLHRIVADYSILDRYQLRSQPFALAVSSPTPNKNFGVISKALTLMGAAAPRCVAVGSADASVFCATGESHTLVHVGYVSDGQLKALYEHATCFLFPSFYEGFGIPPLEAMASGCPVLASTAPGVRETCGSAVSYFDPNSPDELALEMRSLFSSQSQREKMKAAGEARIKLFSWHRSAILNLAALNERISQMS